MVCSKDKMLIKNPVLLKGFSSRRLLHEFPQKCCNNKKAQLSLTNPRDAKAC